MSTPTGNRPVRSASSAPPREARPGIQLVIVIGVLLACSSQRTILQAQDPARSSATISLDVHIVTPAGDPVMDVKADQFAVLIDGHKRSVAGVQFVKADSTYIIAIDRTSLWPSAEPAAREAVRRLLDRIGPDALAGLVAYPGPVSVTPTKNRQTVRAALEKVTGLWSDTPSEKRTSESVSGLESTIQSTATVAGRKTLVVLSAGVAMSTVGGAKSDVEAESVKIRRLAEASNLTLNVLYMDTQFVRQFSVPSTIRLADDLLTYMASLFSFARASGGTLYQLGLGTDRFIGNLVKDSSAYYRIDVETLVADRDGNDHTVSVTIDQPGTVRVRGSVTVPYSR